MCDERFKKFIKEDGITVAIILIIVVAYIFLRTPGDGFESTEALQQQLSSGVPTIVEFYSNTCSICLASKPAVAQMEKDLTGQVQVLQLNIKDEVGRALAVQWGVHGVPTFVILDGQGNQQYIHIGKPDTIKLKQVAIAQIAP